MAEYATVDGCSREVPRVEAETGLSMRRRWAAALTVCLGLFLLGLDLTVLNVAVPDLRDDLNASMRETQWIVDAYVLALGGLVLTSGGLMDRLGRRRAFVAGLVVCAVSSAVGGLVRSPGELIAARAGMGVGAALLMPATLCVITDLFPEPAPRRRAIAVWAAVGGLGGACGPVVGGWLVEQTSWRAAFWVNVPIAALTVLLTLGLVPAPPRRSPSSGLSGLSGLSGSSDFRESSDLSGPRFDVPGALLSASGLLVLVWAVIESPSRGWTDPATLVAYAVAGLLLAGFLVVEHRADAPVLPLALVRPARVGTAAMALAMMSFALFGALFVVTLYLQGVLGYTPWQAGLRVLPLPMGLMAGAAMSLRITARWGEKSSVLLGLLVVAGAFGLLARTSAGSGYGRLLVFLVLGGGGAGLTAAAATACVMNAVPAARAGLGSAVNDATRQVGAALGVAVQGSLLSGAYTSRLDDTLTRAHAPASLRGAGGADNVLSTVAVARRLPPGARERLRAAAADAFVHGMSHAALAAVAVVLAAALVTLRRLPGRDAVDAPPSGAPVQ
ncbi:MFS transporter [Streptomyces sp. NPDC006711]|uniref:MFS transporter n=1 Tax=Streptomyces sp. NPDC006711 TaxID=3364762 RepID=UPI0036AFBA7B